MSLRMPAAALLVALFLGRPAGAATSVPARAPAPPRPASQRPHARAATPPSGTGLQAKLPDTTLVRVFFTKGHSDITLSQLRVGAYRLGASPDSLTPADTRQVLGLLVQQSILTHRVHQAPRHWAPSDSADFRMLEDRLALGAALDSALVEQAYRMATRGDSVPDRDGLGIIVRDSTIAALHPVYDEDMLKLLALDFANRPRPDAAMPVLQQVEVASAVPQVARVDSARTLLTTSAGSCTVGQLLTDLGRIRPTNRPQVRGVEDLRDLCKSKVYEGMLRDAAKSHGFARRPRIARQLAEAAENLDIQRFIAMNVYDKIALDSTTLRRHYAAAPSRYLAPAHAVLVRTVLDQRDAADTLAHRLTVPLFAESLLAQSSRAGASYGAMVDERGDSALYRRAVRAGTGAVIGPDHVRDGWRVVKVMELVPRRTQTFGEAYEQVRNDWGSSETQRRMRELMTQLAASTIVNVNQDSPYLNGQKRIPR